MATAPDLYVSAEAGAASDSIRALLDRAHDGGITLWAEGEIVRFRCKASAMSPPLLAELRAHRTQLLEHLLPQFEVRTGSKPAQVFSFRRTTWSGIKKGWVRVDSTNGTHWVARLRGHVDVDAVEGACLDLVQRHDALRARVFELADRPCVSFEDSQSWRLEHIDLQTRPEAVRDAEAREIASDLIWRPFDLATGPLFRAFVITLSSTEHVLGIVAHHFVADGLSVMILWQELIRSLTQYARQPSAAAGEPRVQYSDYLLAMQEWLDSPASVPHIAYWRERLAGAPAISLPGATGTQPMQQGARLPIQINAELASAVHDTARTLQASPFLVLLAAQFVLVARMSGLEDVTIGSVTLGREVPALQGVVGYLADRVYYRAQLDGNPSFAEVVQRVRASAIEAAAHQFVRADIVKSAIGGNRAVVAPMFNYLPGDALASPAVSSVASVERFPIGPPPARSEAAAEMCYWLELRGTSAGMHGHFRFGGPAIPGLAPAFESILSQVVGRHHGRLHSFRLPATTLLP